MSRNTRIALSLAIVFSVYMIYLLFWVQIGLVRPTWTLYLFPFVAVNQLGGGFLYWLNLISLITLVLWVIWCVLFIRDRK